MRMRNEGTARGLAPSPPLPNQARIGPNAIIQTVQALKECYGPDQAAALLQPGGQAWLLDYHPTEMIDEQLFRDLVLLLVEQIGVADANHILQRSGQYTARYLLQHRIPGPFQRLLKLLPRRLALALLLVAISKHAWTFVGSGTFTYSLGRPPQLTIASGIQSRGAIAGFYAGTFETLLQSLIDAQTHVVPVAAQADGDNRCIYDIRFS